MQEGWVLLRQPLYQSIKQEESIDLHEQLKDVTRKIGVQKAGREVARLGHVAWKTSKEPLTEHGWKTSRRNCKGMGNVGKPRDLKKETDSFVVRLGSYCEELAWVRANRVKTAVQPRGNRRLKSWFRWRFCERLVYAVPAHLTSRLIL